MSKIPLQDFVQYGRLFEIYGSLLSEDRQKIMSDYFEFNMTLAEIAKQRQISRQAVLDAIDKSCAKIKEYESVLNLQKKRLQTEEKLNEIKFLAEKNCQNEILEKVEKLLKEI